MKKLTLVVISSVALASCIAPARHRDLGNGSYEVYATGSALASRDAYARKLDKKAKKVCGGEYEDASETHSSTFKSKSYSGTQPITVNGSTHSKIIKCKPKSQQDAVVAGIACWDDHTVWPASMQGVTLQWRIYSDFKSGPPGSHCKKY